MGNREGISLWTDCKTKHEWKPWKARLDEAGNLTRESGNPPAKALILTHI